MITVADFVHSALLDAERAKSSRLEDGLLQILTRLEERFEGPSVPSAPINGDDGDDLSDFRAMLSEAGFSATAAGMWTAMCSIKKAYERHDEDLRTIDALTTERDGLRAELKTYHDGRNQDQKVIANLMAEREALRAEVVAMTRDRDSLAGDLGILVSECARIDRAITPLGSWTDSDTIGKRVEDVARAVHVRADKIDSLHDEIRQRDAQIAELRLLVTQWEVTAEGMERAADLVRETIKALRAGVDALTPEKWVTTATSWGPPVNRWIVLADQAGKVTVVETAEGFKIDPAQYPLWRTLPAALLTPPEGT